MVQKLHKQRCHGACKGTKVMVLAGSYLVCLAGEKGREIGSVE
ncbi:hypothetical protein CCACVL1_31065 [Corchorus capsularis]|uniref:Uncharacterized protein n=1 Tax=Corchorus capsularis TaxID=210143 RepID=A0A1R3FTZ7_COCAP|nr:hypothetical protein CCACVL1_31065 [Corchorus capsularis]